MYQFDNVPPIFPILQKVLLRLSEQGDVTETQRITFVPPKFFSKLGPVLCHDHVCSVVLKKVIKKRGQGIGIILIHKPWPALLGASGGSAPSLLELCLLTSERLPTRKYALYNADTRGGYLEILISIA